MRKLISPAVSTREIDLSFVPQAVAAIGAGVIGVASKGPAFVPTSVNTMRQYRRIFGNQSKDSFMGYAAKFYLKDQGQLTVVRLLGDSSTGVAIDNGYAIMRSTRARLSGAELKAVIRKTSRSVTRVDAISASNGNVIIKRSYSGGSIASASALVSFYPSDANYIGRVFPTNRKDVRTTGGDPINVGVTYGLYVDTIVKDVSMSAISCSAVAVTSQYVGTKYRPAQSPVVVSQGYGPSGSASVYEMFKVVSNGQGNGANVDVKIQISNISFDDSREYPSFVLRVRRFSDTDSSPMVLESFTVTMDPDSENYILKVIGDRYKKIVTDEGTPYIKVYGDWDNKSEYIRIAHPDSTMDRFVRGLPAVPSNARPQGFKGFGIAGPLCRNGTYLPTVEYVINQKRRTVRTDATATGDLSKRIRLGYDFTRMNPSFLKRQTFFSTSAESFSNYTALGFYVKHSSTDRNPSTGSYLVADVSLNGSDVSSTLIAGGLESNVKIAFPLFAGSDGWMLNTNDTPQQQVMYGEQADAVNDAIDLFADSDDIDVNLLAVPGLGSGCNGQQCNRLIDLCSERGDRQAIIDLAQGSAAASATLTDAIDTTLADATDQARGFDDSYAATFWPWVRIKDANTNELVWVPPSVAAFAAIRYNDKVAYPWYAPAGFDRGVLDFATQARIKVNKDMRDSLYTRGINPIATIKGQVMVFGNKTTQKKTTRLQSLDIKRGLLDLKKLIASLAQFVLFDKDPIRSRDSLLAKVTPVIQDMQSKKGITAYRIVSNPSSDDINRKMLPVKIYVQFTPTTEFVPIDFIVTPVGIQF